MTDTSRRRIFIVDDHPMVRDGLANLLRGAGWDIAGQAEGLREALEHPALAESGLAIVDLALGEESGLTLIKRLRERGLAVLVYSMHEGSHIVRQALAAGAGGYVTKRETAGSLLDAVRAVLNGTSYLSPRAEQALGQVTPLDLLTGQQRQIYRLMGQGWSNEEIARELKISIRTLESYSARIMSKLDLKSIKDLRRQAIRDLAAQPPVPGRGS